MEFSLSAFPVLETERLVLRKTTFQDAQSVFNLRSDPQVNQYIKRENPKIVADAKSFINKVNNGYQQREHIYWAICLKNELEMIGSICLWHFNELQNRAELGYDLLTAYQHKGIMTEALLCIVDFGFQQLELSELEAFTHSQNKNSIALLIKNEFKFMNGLTDPDNKNNVIYRIKKSGNKAL